MAAESGTDRASLKGSSLEKRLENEPFAFRFFQAVRLLEHLWPEREPVGRFARPEQEVARFSANPSLTFPPSEIHALEQREGKPPRVIVNFMGLTGPLGVLPIWYTNLIKERVRAGDTAPRDFLDIFNHRAISLFFHAWEKHRFAISYERGEREGLTAYLLDFVGLGTEGLEDRQDIPDDALLFYAGLLSQRPRSAASMAQILSDYFDVPVEVEQFIGAWYRLDRRSICIMDERPDISQQVGFGAIVGDEVWDQHSRARIKIGPLSMERYLEFLPNGSAFRPLRALTRFFSNGEVDFEVQLILEQPQVPRCELGGEGDARPQLGWVTWMKSGPMDRNPGDTILEL